MSYKELYTRGEAVYIYTSLRGQVCAHVIATPSHNNAPGQCRDIEDIAIINKLKYYIYKKEKAFKYMNKFNKIN